MTTFWIAVAVAIGPSIIIFAAGYSFGKWSRRPVHVKRNWGLSRAPDDPGTEITQ